MSLVVLGLDPGLATTGYAVIEQSKSFLKAVQYGIIETSSKLEMCSRLVLIEKQVNRLIKTFHPQEIACEQIFFFKNVKTALLIGQVRGVLMLISSKQSLPFYEYTPLQIKQSVACYGRAEKRQVQKMVQKVLNLSEMPRPDDAADALACAICHAYSRKMLSL